MARSPASEDAPSSRGGTRLSPRDLLACIEREQELQLNLCTNLELIADELPNFVDRPLANCSIPALRECLPRQSVLEEVYLFPALRKFAHAGDQTEAILLQLSEERQSDEYLAQDIAEHLENALRQAAIEHPNMLGFMLRHFFECRRRHIAWCRGIVLPLARRRLTVSSLAPTTLNDVQASLRAAVSAMQHSNRTLD